MHTSLAGVLKVQDGERITLVDSANHAWSSDSFTLIYLIATIINTPCEWEGQSGVALAFDTTFTRKLSYLTLTTEQVLFFFSSVITFVLF